MGCTGPKYAESDFIYIILYEKVLPCLKKFLQLDYLILKEEMDKLMPLQIWLRNLVISVVIKVSRCI